MTSYPAETAGRLLLEVFLGRRPAEDVNWRDLLSDVFFQGYAELLPFLTAYREELGSAPVVDSFEVAGHVATMRVRGATSAVAIAVTVTEDPSPKVSWIHLNRLGSKPTTWSDLLRQTPTVTAETVAIDSELATELSALMSKTRGESQYAGLALAASRGGEKLYAASQGAAWLGAQSAPTSETPFRAGSLTKPVTALLTLRLAQHGLIDLDAPVTDCLTSVRLVPHGVPATVGDLLDHRSGLPRSHPDDSTKPWLMRERLAAGVTFPRAAGESFEYSNLGFSLLGLLIEDVTGLSYPDAANREVFVPEGMAHSSVGGSPPASPPAATGYDVNGGLVLPTLEYFMSDVPSSGGLVTSTGDLLRLGEAILAEPRMWAAIPSGTESLYARGLRLQAAPEHPFAFHNGMVPGARGTLIMMPAERLVAVGLANGGGDGLDALVMGVAKRLLRR